MITLMTAAPLGQITAASLELGTLLQSGPNFMAQDVTRARRLLDGLAIDRWSHQEALRELLIGCSLFRPLDRASAARLIDLLEKPSNKLDSQCARSYDYGDWVPILGKTIEATLDAMGGLVASGNNPDLSLRYLRFLGNYRRATETKLDRDEACDLSSAFRNLLTDLLMVQLPETVSVRDPSRLKKHLENVLARCMNGDIHHHLPFWDQKITASELRDFAIAVAETCDGLSLADGELTLHPVLTPLTTHALIGTDPTLEEYLRTLANNLKGWLRVFGPDEARLLFNGKTRMVSSIKDSTGNPTNYFLVLQRGRHEYNFGCELAILEGSPRENGLNNLAKIGIHFGEDALQIVNIQGPPQKAMEELAEDVVRFIHVGAGSLEERIEKVRGGRFQPLFKANPFLEEFLDETVARFRGGESESDARARIPGWIQEHRKKLTETLRGTSPLDLLIAATILLAKRWGFDNLHGVSDAAQKARQDELRMDLSGGGYYDLFWLRFDFSKPAAGTDFWEMKVPDSLEDYSARVLPRSSRTRPKKWKVQEADPNAPHVRAFWETLVPALLSMNPAETLGG